jgi:hypothetical protein
VKIRANRYRHLAKCNREANKAKAIVSQLFESKLSELKVGSKSETYKILLKFSVDINFTKVRRIGSFRLTEKVFVTGVPFRDIKSRDRAVEGSPPPIRVRRPVPPAGLFKASAAYSSTTCGEVYAPLA